VSLCPQLDIASQGSSVEEAKSNLQEAIELFFETASQTKINARFKAYEDSWRFKFSIL
jgi:predicted RNase H-like HicB family nuclease